MHSDGFLQLIVKYMDAICIKKFGVLAIGFCSPKSAIAKTGMPLHTHVTLLIFVLGINFRRKAATRNLFSKRKASLKYLKINSLSKLTRYTVSKKMIHSNRTVIQAINLIEQTVLVFYCNSLSHGACEQRLLT